MECAARINTEVAREKGIPPSDYYSSFFALVPDWLSRELAEELASAARLRNMLIHQYEDVEPEQVHAAAVHTTPQWKAYVQAVTDRLG